MSNTKAKGNGRWEPANRSTRQETRRWRRFAFRLEAEPGQVSLMRRLTRGHGLGFRGPGGR